MKTIIVTGANSGIGKEATLKLAQAGNQVIMLSRDSEKSRAARDEIVAATGNQNIVLITADLAEPSSIRQAVAEIQGKYPKIDVLVNNAGLYKVKREENSTGVEMSFAVNYLATFMLCQLLLDNLAASGNGRIVNVVSMMYKGGKINFDDLMLENDYKVGTVYSNTKYAAVLYSAELAQKVKEKEITVNTLHPGVLRTDVFREYPNLLSKVLNLFFEKPEKGGERIIYLATDDAVANTTGKYFYKMEEREIEISAEEKEITERLWKLSEEMMAA
ncbi:MAG: SDR family oxidoreductase [Anaerolineae bacterium]|jgi:NAD(P)-dependent dehydrogenase (short-subunit alcohol dehydrogenase family)|nr:SDR family oxidoreductase [Anaerolineae bacterium]MBT7073203.1 SDR family oxidoreductase [Anaerolineae bacterium]MBT7326343.1 SDR family oxidoreductase [Anaerolineae bacterium]